MTPPLLHCIGPVFSYQGYAIQNRHLIHGLAERRWNIHLEPTDDDQSLTLEYGHFFRSLASQPTPTTAPALSLTLLPAPAEPPHSPRDILFTMLESDDTHPLYLLRAAQFHDVIVPTRFNVRALIAGGFPARRLHVVPSGFDPLAFFPAPITTEPLDNDRPRFLHVGTWQERKASVLTVAELATACATAGRGSVHVHTNYRHTYGPRALVTILANTNNSLGLNDRSVNRRITWHTKQLEPSQVAELYRSMDYVVSMSRGEAWNLPLLEATASGAVPIWHYAHAHKEWMAPAIGVPIATAKNILLDDVEPRLLDHYRGCTFKEPNFDELARTLGWILGSWSRCIRPPSWHTRARTKALAHVQQYTWDNASDELDRTLRTIMTLKTNDLTALDIMRKQTP